MKKLFIMALLCAMTYSLKAQNTFPSSGNVGIGTTTPGTTLDVIGPIANNRNWFYLAGAGDTNHAIGNVGGDGEQFRFFNFLDLFQSANGKSAFYINNVGFAGVGTNNPGDKLVINGAIRTVVNSPTGYGSYGGGLVAFDQDNGGNNIFSLVRQSNNLAISAFDGIGFSTNVTAPSTTYQMYVNSGGHVGIGTTNPLSLLNVNGNIAALAATNTTNTYFLFQRPSDGYVGARIGNAYAMNGYQGHLVFETNNGGGITDMVERMRITSDGNVGIGTTSPGSTLTVRSASSGVSIEPGSGSYFGTFAFNRESRTGAIFNSSANAFQINNGGNDQNLHFQVYHGDGSIVTDNALVIAGTNGNIGIGTTDDSNWQLANSTYKLAVGGSVIATAVTVKLRSAWPDYVFMPKYTLMPLADVKSYIDKNHHLPDMPSAAQVEKDGLNLGEMNKLLLKKVEELTLYLIERDKENKEQQQINVALSNRMQIQNARIDKLEKLIEKGTAKKPLASK